MKKIKFCFISLFCFFLFSAPLAAEPGTFYKDVKIGDWYYEPVKYATEHQLMHGMGERRFSPDENLTRAMFVQMVFNLDGAVPVEHYENTFSDVSEKDWFCNAVYWAAANEIVVGYGNGIFDPQKRITRQEMAKIIAVYLEKEGILLPETEEEPTPFTDFDDCSFWAADSVLLIQKTGILSGYEDGSFRPQRTAKRSEAATIFSKTYALIHQEAVEFKTPPITPTDSVKYIYHSGGIVDDAFYTNSLEAMNQTYLSGGRFIELDFNWTTDEELVCIHEFSARFAPEFADLEASLEEFLNAKIMGKYTSVDLAALKDWLENHPDAYIITDIKTDNVKALAKITEDYPEVTKRLIPQIYDPGEYDAVADLGYQKIVLTLYKIPWEEASKADTFVAFASEHPLFAFTFPEYLAKEEYVKILAESNAYLYTHTINDATLTEAYLAMGLTGVYTDILFD